MLSFISSKVVRVLAVLTMVGGLNLAGFTAEEADAATRTRRIKPCVVRVKGSGNVVYVAYHPDGSCTVTIKKG